LHVLQSLPISIHCNPKVTLNRTFFWILNGFRSALMVSLGLVAKSDPHWFVCFKSFGTVV
jgi:hypothetical protein